MTFTKASGTDWVENSRQAKHRKNVFVYTATEFSGELIDFPEGQLGWISDEKILDLNLWESDHIFFPWIAEGKFFSAKFEYDGDEMRGCDVVFHS